MGEEDLQPLISTPTRNDDVVDIRFVVDDQVFRQRFAVSEQAYQKAVSMYLRWLGSIKLMYWWIHAASGDSALLRGIVQVHSRRFESSYISSAVTVCL